MITCTPRFRPIWQKLLRTLPEIGSRGMSSLLSQLCISSIFCQLRSSDNRPSKTLSSNSPVLEAFDSSWGARRRAQLFSPDSSRGTSDLACCEIAQFAGPRVRHKLDYEYHRRLFVFRSHRHSHHCPLPQPTGEGPETYRVLTDDTLPAPVRRGKIGEILNPPRRT